MDELEALYEKWLEEAQRRTTTDVWIPHTPTPKQSEFLACTEREALYGGAAGGGKTDALLMGALQYVDQPGYSALILRKTFPQLNQADGPIERSHEWLSNTRAHWNGTEHRWTFPSGATLTFGHFQHEKTKYDYQGGAWHYIAFDELTQFAQTQYAYLHSRCRRKANQIDGIPLRIRSASNPGGIGHDWVYKHFVKPGDPSRPFIASRLEDNPHLDQEGYRESLQGLDDTTRRQLEKGEWIRDVGGLIYPITSDNLIEVADLPPFDSEWRFILGVDLGTSQRKPTTGLVVNAYSWAIPDIVYTLKAETHAKQNPTTTAQHIEALGLAYPGGFNEVHVDAGGLGGGYIDEFENRFGIPVQAAQKNSKLGYRKLLRGALEQRHKLIVESACEVLIEEYNTLSWNENGTDCEKGADDHASDADLYSWRGALAYRASTPPSDPTPKDPAKLAEYLMRKRLNEEREAMRKRVHGGRWGRR